ncbi:FKBP-type peptidyl-prolyl cis-trans isomerase family protein [Trifolium repens]|nr:FKBP-type peptidyl-prolyl cis-trans isomerase family protein [Trifolium repens]
MAEALGVRWILQFVVDEGINSISIHCDAANVIPKGREMGIGTMVREEKAVIYVTSQYLTESPLMPVIEHSQVQFEVELVHFIQVRDVLGDERLIKRRIRDGKGLDLEYRVPEGFELCVRLMLPGEMALVTCPPDYAYDKFPRTGQEWTLKV